VLVVLGATHGALPAAAGGRLRYPTMILRILIGWAVLAVAFYVTTLIVPGIQVSGGVVGYLLVALIFGLINAILGPIVRLLTLPLSIITFGLFFLVVNGFLLWLTEVFTDRLHIEHFFFDAIFGALILGLVSWLLSGVLYRAIPSKRG
jgi:putative membrane protein